MRVNQPQKLGLTPTFGYGDRLGNATPGHIYSHRAHGNGIAPIFAQQSIRELERTGRTANDVIRTAREAVINCDFSDPWGADADHLKTIDDVALMVRQGYTFYTIDPSDHVNDEADLLSESELETKFDEMDTPVPWVDTYSGKSVTIDSTVILEFDHRVLMRAAVKYAAAIDHTLDIAREIESRCNAAQIQYEIEVSIDESEHPTTLPEHFIIADQCIRAGVSLISMAPRYPGQFEKGIDFKGDLTVFSDTLAKHAAIARYLGPYKLSLHSGSDKLSIYPIFSRITKGLYHVKTAGTSYLEALRVVARVDASLFRQIVNYSCGKFQDDRRSYHISGQLDKLPVLAGVADDVLEEAYLVSDDSRQVLHVTFGSVLNNPDIGPAMQTLVEDRVDVYHEVLEEHFNQHLIALQGDNE
tara:strand:+ start:4825 stop:6066 length:1242 start_codon:yes stop_codon:yes gene_type:complete